MSRILAAVAIAALSLSWSGAALAHGGRLNAQGCHNDRKNGGYHCHRSRPVTSEPSKQERPTTVPSGPSADNPFSVDRVDDPKEATPDTEAVPMSVCREIFKTDPQWMNDPVKRDTVARCK